MTKCAIHDCDKNVKRRPMSIGIQGAKKDYQFCATHENRIVNGLDFWRVDLTKGGVAMRRISATGLLIG